MLLNPLFCTYVACSVHTGAACTLIDVNFTVTASVAGSTCTLVPIDQILREGRRERGRETERREGRRERGVKMSK